jgi:hypothetical protein
LLYNKLQDIIIYDKKFKVHGGFSMYERSYKLTCKDCGWYVILRRNGGMMSMFINNFNCCPKCKSTQLETSIPSLLETINPVEQFRKYFYKISGK